MKNRTCRILAIAALTMGSSSAALSAEESGWDWSLALYGWLAGINDTISVNGNEIAEVDLSFTDILDKLDMVTMVHGEGFRDQWGFFADYLYLDISDKKNTPNGRLRAEIASTIFELAGVYRPSGAIEGFEAFAGIRYFKPDIVFDLTAAGITNRTRVEDSFTDFMVGARYTGAINENWFYRLRADASGGETEGTWSLLASAGYKFGSDLDKSVIVGYRHLELDLEDDNGPLTVKNDLTMSGPFVAINFSF